MIALDAVSIKIIITIVIPIIGIIPLGGESLCSKLEI